MAATVEKAYGEALFETVLESGKMDEIHQEIRELIGVFRSNPELDHFLKQPQTAREAKEAILEELFEGKISEELMGFLSVMAQKDRAGELMPAFRYFIDRMREYHKESTAFITSALKLDDEQKQRIEKRLREVTGNREFLMYYSIDPMLIGGIVARVDDRVVDSSIRTQLERLSKELRSAGLGKSEKSVKG